MSDEKSCAEWGREDNNLTSERQNREIREASDDMTSNSKLVSFLYQLMRDELTPGAVEKLVREVEAEERPVHFCNGWLARYSGYLADRLRDNVRLWENQTAKSE